MPELEPEADQEQTSEVKPTNEQQEASATKVDDLRSSRAKRGGQAPPNKKKDEKAR